MALQKTYKTEIPPLSVILHPIYFVPPFCPGKSLATPKKKSKPFGFGLPLFGFISHKKQGNIRNISISLASPQEIIRWAERILPNGKIIGKVTNANTKHYKTFKPIKGGLFCERIFGPLKDFECACGVIQKSIAAGFSSTPSKITATLSMGVARPKNADASQFTLEKHGQSPPRSFSPIQSMHRAKKNLSAKPPAARSFLLCWGPKSIATRGGTSLLEAENKGVYGVALLTPPERKSSLAKP
jgi:hypothetical protein